MTRILPGLLAALVVACAATAEEITVRGTVVDADGRPVSGAQVDTFWSFDDGSATADDAVTTGDDGTFALPVQFYNRDVAIAAFDGDRQRGGVTMIAPGAIDEPATVELGPLVRVLGRIESAKLGRAPSWVNVYARMGARGPVIGGCMRTDATFSFTLPPGRYVLWSYGDDVQDRTDPVTLAIREPEVDLGVLDIPPTVIAMHYGKKPPAWRVSEARGAGRNAQLSDYKGKWVLLEFWGYW